MENTAQITNEAPQVQLYLETATGERTPITREQAKTIFDAYISPSGRINSDDHIDFMLSRPGTRHIIQPEELDAVNRILKPPVTDRIPFFKGMLDIFKPKTA